MSNKKNNLNISLGVDVDGLKKGFDDAVKVTQSKGKDIEKEAAKMALAVTQKIEGMSLKSQARQLENLTAKMAEAGLTGTKAFRDVARGAAQLKADIDDTKGIIDAFRPDAPFNALNATLQGGVQAFAGVQGAMALIGAEGEDLQKVLVKVQGAMALAEGVKSIDALSDGFEQLGTVIKANPIMAVATALLALGTAAIATAASIDDLSASEEAQLQIAGEAAKAVAEEGFKIKMLASIYDDANLPLDARKEAYNQLKNISPDLVRGLDKEGRAAGKASVLAAEYTKKLIEQAKVKAGLDLITDAYKKLINAQLELQRKQKGDLSAGDYAIAVAGFFASGGQLVSATTMAVNGQTEEVNKLAKAYKEVEDIVIKIGKSTIKTAQDVKDIADNLGGGKSSGGGDNNKEVSFNPPSGNRIDFNTNLEKSGKYAKYYGNVNGLGSAKGLGNISTSFNLPKYTDEMNEADKAYRQLVGDLGSNLFQDAISGISDSLAAAMRGESLADSMRKMFASILNTIADFMIKYGEQAGLLAKLMSAINKAIKLQPEAAIPFALAMVAGGVALKAMANNFSSVPKLADGGIAYGPTMALVGEYSGAGANPEVIAPLDKLQKMLAPMNSGGGVLTARVSGTDLVFILDQTNKNKRRG